jgi:hypothetical protein
MQLDPLALFIWLIIRLIQLVFSAGTVFFSHKKSVNSVFQSAYNSSRTGLLTGQCIFILPKMPLYLSLPPYHIRVGFIFFLIRVEHRHM